uniref:Uncharacterized LOC108243356 n=1 Tax=Kryptolebias marmoratus TaxID=37003 RepID=A0A3Q3AJI0_KRYMA
MCTAGNSDEIIILSDDEEEEDKENDLSCLIVELLTPVCVSDRVSSSSIQDEDVVVMFSRGADVLPHARHDCPVHPFVATEKETGAPVAKNQLICDQCFCYICDKLASLCVVWCHSGVCHCNSHLRSNFWNNVRYVHLVGDLAAFNLALSEIDSHLRRAGTEFSWLLHSTPSK